MDNYVKKKREEDVKHSRLKFILFIFLFSIIFVLLSTFLWIISLYFIDFFVPDSAKSPTLTENQIIPMNTVEPTTNQSVVIVKSDSYRYGNKILFYAKNPQLQYSDQYVTIYFSDGTVKTEIEKIRGPTSDKTKF
ncbi:hypothetical protein KKA09_00135 [Patescibacteria group bacterium]|nr:hypothetical protein [Patescibacteria group bacterium]